MLVLGIETSCDETAAAVVRREADGRASILSNVVRSQLDEHRAYGGVVPEIAARAHVDLLDHLVDQALREAGVRLAEVDAVAATAGPGLIGGLLVGVMTGKALAFAAGKPFLAINHLEGHALTPRLTDGIGFPYLLLLVTGGHTQLVAVHGLGRYERLGTTVDDAVGEAFDKVAKLLGLGYPGGPALERAATQGDPHRFALPRPMSGRPNCDFSFSGLKTAVRIEAERLVPLSEQDVADLCAGFQAAVVDVIRDRTRRALELFAGAIDPNVPLRLVVAGGVAANGSIRAALEELAFETGAALVAPPLRLCGDNAAMIAFAGAERLAAGETGGMETKARARWPLSDMGAAA
ncbi:tRNA (adenosine(37)-N6)-threonylcarbamoyltransferase complex transferase subunit TsaD [Lutibaculum baratangense]|uniref:tRNA N6-adenosine threonylcarbamoyltransferase n=1 Tax=Lutibaculum baratangense AMV1 TaxID=631454 RepID=V4RAZ6_9HYPH|nr:tRNA (adenosine(37)-N6)-threonylcarbamoyltransferase complex transferase subunit TsaD [Lutibaculum baratangense]ESR22574.1 YgjD/Kae1/Qri7 family, required for threonylcarbamoyladenosine (t(6)A) formation in tRNA [Lutibaculum baratangense AMV1]